MTAAVFADTEAAVRTWIRSLGLAAFFAVPTGAGVVFPLVTVSRIGGRPQAGQAPLEDVLLVLDVWGTTKEQAADAMRTLGDALVAAESVPLDERTWCYGFTVENVVWLPDPPPSKLKRYSMTVTATVAARALP